MRADGAVCFAGSQAMLTVRTWSMQCARTDQSSERSADRRHWIHTPGRPRGEPILGAMRCRATIR